MHLLEGTDNIQDTTMTMLNNGSVEASNASIPIPNSSQSKCDKMSFGQALRHRVIKVVPPPKKQHPQPSVSQAEEGKLKFPTPEDPSDNLAFYILFSTYLSFGMMVFVSFCRELLATLFYQGAEETKDLRVQNVTKDFFQLSKFHVLFLGIGTIDDRL